MGEAAELRIDEYDGNRADLRWLFEEAEDSALLLDGYITDGRVFVAGKGGDVVGLLQLVESPAPYETEIKNMAVAPASRGTGIGRQLIEHAIDVCRRAGGTRVTVATGAADVGNLRFYQRCGFRMVSVEPDAFTPATGYPDGIVIDGIPLRDRVWLAQAL